MNDFIVKLCEFGLFSGNKLLKATVPTKTNCVCSGSPVSLNFLQRHCVM